MQERHAVTVDLDLTPGASAFRRGRIPARNRTVARLGGRCLEPGPDSRFTLIPMRLTILVSAVALMLTACDSKKRAPRDEPAASAPQQPRATAPLVDVTAASTLAPVREAFNAHKAEARFLTLLSPT